MIRPLAYTAALALLPLATHAQSTLERLEAVAVTMNGMMNEALAAEIPALEGNLPDPAWDEPMRAAYTCMYEAYVDRVGNEPVAQLVTDMEDMAATLSPIELLANGAAVETPEGITDAEALEIVEGCNLIGVFMDRMAASGAMEIMMQQQ